MSFAAIIAVVFVAAIMIACFKVYTLLVYTNTRSIEAE